MPQALTQQPQGSVCDTDGTAPNHWQVSPHLVAYQKATVYTDVPPLDPRRRPEFNLFGWGNDSKVVPSSVRVKLAEGR